MNVERRERCCALNDKFRKTLIGGRIFLTGGIAALGEDQVEAVMKAVCAFDAFTEDNDPYGEHDFGALTVGPERVFWKIDYYDHGLSGQAVDPTDPSVCTRVLTVMLAHEY